MTGFNTSAHRRGRRAGGRLGRRHDPRLAAVNVQQVAAAMTAAATKWLETLTPEQRQQATFPQQQRREGPLELHSHEHVPAQGRAVEGNDRAAAQAGARAAQGKPQPEGLPYRNVNHGARDAPARDRELRRQERRKRPRPRALLLHALRHAVAKERLGIGASRAITSRCTSPSGTTPPSTTRRRSSERTRRKFASKARRRACESSGRWKMPRAR